MAEPISTALLLGALTAGGSALGSYFANKKNASGASNQAPTQQIPRLAPESIELQNAGIKEAMNILKGEGTGFEPIKAEARRGFKQETLPVIAERYNARFGPESYGSTGFQNMNNQAAQDFETKLAAMKANFGNNQLSSLLNLGTQPRFDTLVNQPSQGAFGSVLSGLAPSLGAAIPLLASSAFSGQGQQGTGGGLDPASLAQLISLISQQGGAGLGGGQGGIRFNEPSQGVFANQALAPQGFRVAGF